MSQHHPVCRSVVFSSFVASRQVWTILPSKWVSLFAFTSMHVIMTVFDEPIGSTTDSFLSIRSCCCRRRINAATRQRRRKDPKCCLFSSSVRLGIFPSSSSSSSFTFARMKSCVYVFSEVFRNVHALCQVKRREEEGELIRLQEVM